MFAWWWASGEVLEAFRWGLVPGTPAIQEVWEIVRQVHYEALVDVFGAASAEVSDALKETLASPFASPVSSPVLPSPQHAAMPKPAAAEVLPQNGAAEVLLFYFLVSHYVHLALLLS